MDLIRYERQLKLPELGEEGQQRLSSASVLVCGVGGLGCPCSLYLTAMGIGTLGLLDGDIVSLSNLNRQVLYTQNDIGKKKVGVAAARLKAFSPDTRICVYDEFLTEKNVEDLLAPYDIIVDCFDSIEGRFILNDACLRFGKPLVHAGVAGLCGQAMVVIPRKTPCLRCLFRYSAAPKEKTPVLGATAGMLGIAEAIMVYQLILKNFHHEEMLWFFEGYDLELQKSRLAANKDCICRKICSQGE